MLLCLDREHRLAYIVGEILELDHNEAAAIVGISRSAYRQRLSRARKAIIDFTARICGIANPENACRCAGRLPYAIERGRVQLGRPLFGESIRETAARFADIEETVRSLKRLRRAAALFRTHPRFTVGHDLAPGEVARRR
jgi:hypothetical protein